MKFSIQEFFSKYDQTVDLVTFTENILNGKLHLLCSFFLTWFSVEFPFPLTSANVKHSHTLAEKHFVFLRKLSKLSLKLFQYHIFTSVEGSGR